MAAPLTYVCSANDLAKDCKRSTISAQDVVNALKYCRSLLLVHPLSV